MIPGITNPMERRPGLNGAPKKILRPIKKIPLVDEHKQRTQALSSLFSNRQRELHDLHGQFERCRLSAEDQQSLQAQQIIKNQVASTVHNSITRVYDSVVSCQFILEKMSKDLTKARNINPKTIVNDGKFHSVNGVALDAQPTSEPPANVRPFPTLRDFRKSKLANEKLIQKVIDSTKAPLAKIKPKPTNPYEVRFRKPKKKKFKKMKLPIKLRAALRAGRLRRLRAGGVKRIIRRGVRRARKKPKHVVRFKRRLAVIRRPDETSASAKRAIKEPLKSVPKKIKPALKKGKKVPMCKFRFSDGRVVILPRSIIRGKAFYRRQARIKERKRQRELQKEKERRERARERHIIQVSQYIPPLKISRLDPNKKPGPSKLIIRPVQQIAIRQPGPPLPPPPRIELNPPTPKRKRSVRFDEATLKKEKQKARLARKKERERKRREAPPKQYKFKILVLNRRLGKLEPKSRLVQSELEYMKVMKMQNYPHGSTISSQIGRIIKKYGPVIRKVVSKRKKIRAQLKQQQKVPVFAVDESNVEADKLVRRLQVARVKWERQKRRKIQAKILRKASLLRRRRPLGHRRKRKRSKMAAMLDKLRVMEAMILEHDKPYLEKKDKDVGEPLAKRPKLNEESAQKSTGPVLHPDYVPFDKKAITALKTDKFLDLFRFRRKKKLRIPELYDPIFPEGYTDETVQWNPRAFTANFRIPPPKPAPSKYRVAAKQVYHPTIDDIRPLEARGWVSTAELHQSTNELMITSGPDDLYPDEKKAVPPRMADSPDFHEREMTTDECLQHRQFLEKEIYAVRSIRMPVTYERGIFHPRQRKPRLRYSRRYYFFESPACRLARRSLWNAKYGRFYGALRFVSPHLVKDNQTALWPGRLKDPEPSQSSDPNDATWNLRKWTLSTTMSQPNA